MKARASYKALGDLCRRPVASVTSLAALAFAVWFARPLEIEAQQVDTGNGVPDARWEIVLRNRAFIIPESVVQGLPIQPTLGIWWRPRSRLQVGIDAQTVDNSGPGVQGNYTVSRTVPGGGSGNFLQEITYVGRGDLLPSTSRNRVTATLAWSRAIRSYLAVDRTTHDSVGGNRRRSVFSVEGAYSRSVRRGHLGGGAAVAWIARDDAMYLRALPGEGRRFGPLVGATAVGDVQLAGPLHAWGRLFVPIGGNNSVARASGRPTRAAAYDAGLSLALSPFTRSELFVSNALGNTGALAFVSDREYRALGAGLRVTPDARPLHSVPSVDHRPTNVDGSPLAVAAVSGGWLAAHEGSLHVRRSAQGLLASAEWAPVPGIQGGVFLDLLDGVRDEGELGALLRIALRGTTSGVVPRIDLVASGSRTNNPLVNLLAGSWREIERLGLPKGGFRFGDENGYEGRLYVLTLSLPIEWRPHNTRLLLAPTGGYVQRNGLQLSGLALGAERELSPAVKIGVDGGFALGRGNVLLAERRAHTLPFSLSASWQPRLREGANHSPISLDAFVTNRAGDSPFHTLRVRAERRVSAGIGLTLRLR